MPTLRGVPATGVVALTLLLAGLSVSAGIGTWGWLAGIGYLAAVSVALNRGMRRSGASRLGPANRVTLTRAVLIAGVTALAAESLRRPPQVGVLVLLTAVALALDGVDGAVARRTGSASALGARFDMETDASLLLVLGGYVAHLATAPGVLVAASLIGGVRYAFVVASWAWAWLARPLPPRHWRKVVAATQGVVLVAVASQVLPTVLSGLALAAAVALLAESFGRDVVWLWRRRMVRPDLAADLSVRLTVRRGGVHERVPSRPVRRG
jgi:phosphatidylglycerophosphate synthase